MSSDYPAFALIGRRLGRFLIIILALFVIQTLIGQKVYAGSVPDLVIHKTANVTAVAPGDMIIYTLSYTNVGSVDAVGVMITEPVPDNTQYVASASTAGWVCLPNLNAGSVCTLSLLLIPANTPDSVKFAVKVVNSVPAGITEISNTANIDDIGDPTPTDNSDTITTLLAAAPDLSITKSDGGVSVVPGGGITYTLSYANNGNQGATGVMLTEIVPANTTFTGSGWSCLPNTVAGSICTKSIGALAAGSSDKASFVVTVVNPVPAGVTEIANNASISDDGANGVDPTSANNVASETTPVIAAPDLSITKSDGGVSVVPGGVVTYTLSYINTGNQDATGVILHEPIPANTTFIGSGWLCLPNTVAGSTCTKSIGALAAGSSDKASFVVTVVNPVPAGVVQINNTASISDDGANGVDPTPATNNASDSTPLTAAPDLVLSKTDGGASGIPGGAITYTLNYTNAGNQGATGVVIVETVPANTKFKSTSSMPGWACLPTIDAGSVCKLTIGALASGSHSSALFAVSVVNPVPAGVTHITNNASINDDSGNGVDPTPSNNKANDTTPLNAAPTWLLDKRHDVSVAEPGKAIVYTLVYTNAGNQAAAGVIITETVPANTKFIASGSTIGWICTPSSGAASSVCKLAIGNVAGGAHGSVTFAVSVVTSLPSGVTQISNSAFIGDNRTPSVASATDVTPVKAAAGLVIDKTDHGVTVKPGATLTYTLAYTNTGNQTAAGVMLTETVPANTSFVGDATIWHCSSTAPRAICTHASGDLSGSMSGSLMFVVRVNNQLPAGVAQLINVAKIGHSTAADVSQSSTATPVDAAPDLSLTNDDGGVKVKPGATIAYTLRYANVGNQGATGVVINEIVPDHTSFAANTSSPGWNCAGSTCTYLVSNLVTSATGSVIFAVNVNGSLPLGVGQVTNSATIGDDGGNGADLNPANNTATDMTLLSVSFALIATKQDTLVVDADGNQAASPGDTLEYLITLHNTGNNGLSNVNFQDSLDANTQLAPGGSVQTSQGNVSSGNSAADQTVQVAVGAMASEAAVEISFRVQIKSPLPGRVREIVNQGVVKSSELPDVLTDDPDVAGTSDATRSLLLTPVVLQVKLTDYLLADADNDDKVSGGDTLLYRLTVFNAGNAGINDLVIDDTPGAQSTLMAGTVRTDQGDFIAGNATGDTRLQVHIDAGLPSGGRATISFQVKVNKNVTATQIVNQAQVTVKQGNNPILVLSDDPDTGQSGDATTTPVGGHIASPVGSKIYLPVIIKR